MATLYISEKSVILYRGCVTEMGSTLKIYQNPFHPYTKMLMAAMPRLDKKWDNVTIDLKAKNLENVHGCVYYSRCPIADKALGCDTHRPPLLEIEPEHFVACFAAKKV